MSIAAEMDAALFVLALATMRSTDPVLRDQLTAAQQRFEELRLAVLQLEELCCAPPRPEPGPCVPPGWRRQRLATGSDLATGEIVSLDQARHARAPVPRP